MDIIAYKGHTAANINENQYVVDIADAASIASVIKHHIDNFDDYLQKITTRSKNGRNGVEYGTINIDGKFEQLMLACDTDFDEEALFNAAVKFTELLPLLEEYAHLIIKASAAETSSGPWTTEETILGEFLIPALAMKDKKYMSLLGRFMKASIEIRCSANYQQKFGKLMNDVSLKYGGGDKFQSFLNKWLCTDGDIDYKANDEFRKIRSKGLSDKDKATIVQRIQYNLSNNVPADKLMRNAYGLLICMSFQMPLTALQQAFSQIEAGATPDLNALNTGDFAEWEAMYSGIPNFYWFSFHFSKKDDLQTMLETMVNRFDELFLYWQYMGCSDLRLTDLDGKYSSCGSDSAFFAQVVKHPEFEELTREYVKKHIEANKRFPLVADIRGLGNYAAAALAVYNEENDELILQYLNSLPDSCDPTYLCSFWKDVKANPQLPKTAEKFPSLKK